MIAASIAVCWATVSIIIWRMSIALMKRNARKYVEEVISSRVGGNLNEDHIWKQSKKLYPVPTGDDYWISVPVMVLFWPFIVLMYAAMFLIFAAAQICFGIHYVWSGSWAWFITGEFEPRKFDSPDEIDAGMGFSWLLGGFLSLFQTIPSVNSLENESYFWIGYIYFSIAAVVYLSLILIAKIFAREHPEYDYEDVLAEFIPWQGIDFRGQWWAYALNWPFLIAMSIVIATAVGIHWVLAKPCEWIAGKIQGAMQSSVLKGLVKPVKRQVIEAGKHAYRSVRVREEVEMVPLYESSEKERESSVA